MAINLESTNEEKKEFISKVIFPGNQVVKINSFKLMPGYKEPDINLVINVESKPIQDENFEGFLIDKDDESKGRHQGQVGSVKYKRWAFNNDKYVNGAYVTQESKSTNPNEERDGQIGRALCMMLKEMGCAKWLTDNNNKFDYIEDMVEALNKDMPFKNIWVEMAIGAREYYSKDNYKKQDLFLLRAKSPEKNFKLASNGLVSMVQYNPNDANHLIPAKDVVVAETKSDSVEAPSAPVAPTIAEQPKTDELPF